MVFYSHVRQLGDISIQIDDISKHSNDASTVLIMFPPLVMTFACHVDNDTTGDGVACPSGRHVFTDTFSPCGMYLHLDDSSLVSVKSKYKPSGQTKLIIFWLQCMLSAYRANINMCFFYHLGKIQVYFAFLTPNVGITEEGEEIWEQVYLKVKSKESSAASLDCGILCWQTDSWISNLGNHPEPRLCECPFRCANGAYIMVISLLICWLEGMNVTSAWLVCRRQHDSRDQVAWLVSEAPGESIAAGEGALSKQPVLWLDRELQWNWRHGGGPQGDIQGPTKRGLFFFPALPYHSSCMF